MMAYLDEHSFRPRLHRWRFDLRTGRTREEPLDDRILEFGMINQQYTGVPNRYVYSSKSKPGWFLFIGFVKHDLATGQSWELDLGAEPLRERSAVRAAARRARRGRRLSRQLRHRREHRHVGVHRDRCQAVRRRPGVPHRATAQDLQRHARPLGRTALPSRIDSRQDAKSAKRGAKTLPAWRSSRGSSR